MSKDLRLGLQWGRKDRLGIIHRNSVVLKDAQKDAVIWSAKGSLQNCPETVFGPTPQRVYIENSSTSRYGDLGSQFYTFNDQAVYVHSEGQTHAVSCHPELSARSSGEWSPEDPRHIYFTNSKGRVFKLSLDSPSVVLGSTGLPPMAQLELLNKWNLIGVTSEGGVEILDLRSDPGRERRRSSESHSVSMPPVSSRRFQLCVIPRSTTCALLDRDLNKLRLFDWRRSTVLEPGAEVWSVTRSTPVSRESTEASEVSECVRQPARRAVWHALGLQSPSLLLLGSMNVESLTGDAVIAALDLRKQDWSGCLASKDLDLANCCTSLACRDGVLAALTCSTSTLMGMECAVNDKAVLLPFFKT